MREKEMRKTGTKEEDVIYLGGIIKRVSNFDMGSLKDRKILQKTVYLMQAFGISIGYHFSWYIYGPYSTALTKIGFQLVEKYDEISASRFVNQEAEKKFERFLDFISDIKNNDEFLEILASLHYLKDKNSDKDGNILIDFLQTKKPSLDREMCEDAWLLLEKFGLVN